MEDIQLNKIKVGIIGAGGLGREIDSWICSDKASNLEVEGFWDDNLEALNKFNLSKGVIGTINDDNLSENLLIGIMDCDFKEKIFEAIDKKKRHSILSYIHESVLIGSRIQLDEGVVIFPNAVISCDVKIGRGAFINLGTHVGHDVAIGDYVSIMPNVDLGGNSIIENNVFIGSGSTILPGVKILAHTRIGAGSVIVKTIKESGTYFGNPAKRIF